MFIYLDLMTNQGAQDQLDVSRSMGERPSFNNIPSPPVAQIAHGLVVSDSAREKCGCTLNHAYSISKRDYAAGYNYRKIVIQVTFQRQIPQKPLDNRVNRP